MAHKERIVYIYFTIYSTLPAHSKLTQSFTPVCMHTIKPHKFRHAPLPPSKFSPMAKPASPIIGEELPWLWKRRTDSTRYWYDAQSPAKIAPNNGITENEYWSYSLRRCLSETEG